VNEVNANSHETRSETSAVLHTSSLEAIGRAAPVLEAAGRATRILEAIQWPREVEERFFASGCTELPAPSYEIDREGALTNVNELDALAMTLDVSDPIQRWLTSVARSYADGSRLVLAIGTQRFHEISCDVYGSAKTRFDRDTTNLDVALHLERRMRGEAAVGGPTQGLAQHPEDEPTLTDLDFARALQQRAREIGLSIEVSIDDRVSAKVLAGSTRVRVRAGAMFHAWEVDGLFFHEVETHALSAQNGAAQPALRFLRSGGPRTTRTQEGLAVFSELYNHSLTVPRMKRLVERVKLVAMAEEGADFLDLFRHLREFGESERDAYLDAQRICRGGLVTGGAPFTKDACYLAGLVDVFNFLRVAVRGGAREAVEMIACGRIALADLPVIVSLAHRGVLRPSPYTPRWLASWDALLPFFAFTSFMHEISLDDVARTHAQTLGAIGAVDT
jgi:uncharacterized protein (TIGR02421 family)